MINHDWSTFLPLINDRLRKKFFFGKKRFFFGKKRFFVEKTFFFEKSYFFSNDFSAADRSCGNYRLWNVLQSALMSHLVECANSAGAELRSTIIISWWSNDQSLKWSIILTVINHELIDRSIMIDQNFWLDRHH